MFATVGLAEICTCTAKIAAFNYCAIHSLKITLILCELLATALLPVTS